MPDDMGGASGTSEIQSNFVVNFDQSVSNAAKFEDAIKAINDQVTSLASGLSKFSSAFSGSLSDATAGANSVDAASSELKEMFTELQSTLSNAANELDSISSALDDTDASGQLVTALQEVQAKIEEAATSLSGADIGAELDKVNTTLSEKLTSAISQLSSVVESADITGNLDTSVINEDLSNLMLDMDQRITEALQAHINAVSSTLLDGTTVSPLFGFKPMQSLPKNIQTRLQQSVGDVSEYDESGVDSATVTNAYNANSIDSVRTAFQKAIQKAIQADGNDIRSQLGSIEPTPVDSTIIQSIQRSLEQVNRDVVSKIRDTVNEQITMIREEIDGIVPNTYPANLQKIASAATLPAKVAKGVAAEAAGTGAASASASEGGTAAQASEATKMATFQAMSQSEMNRLIAGETEQAQIMRKQIKALNTSLLFEEPSPQFVRGDRQIGMINPQEEFFLGHKTLEGSAVGFTRGALTMGLMALPFTALAAGQNDYSQYATAFTKVQQNMSLGNTPQQAQANARQVMNSVQDMSVLYGVDPNDAYQAAMLGTRRYKNPALATQFTQQTMMLNRLDNVDMTQGAKAYESFLSAYKLNPQNSSYFARIVTAAAHSSQATGSDITSALEKSASVGAQLGMSPAQLVASIAATVTNTGQTGGSIGTFIKALVSRMTNSTAQKALQGIGIDVLNPQTGKQLSGIQLFTELAQKLPTLNQASQTATLQDVFGTYHLNQAMGLLGGFENSSQSTKNSAALGMIRTYGQLLDEIQKFSPQQMNMMLAMQTNSPSGQMQQAKSAFSVLATTVGQELQPAFSSLAKVATNLFLTIADHAPLLTSIVSELGKLAIILPSMAMGRRLGRSFKATRDNIIQMDSQKRGALKASQHSQIAALLDAINKKQQIENPENPTSRTGTGQRDSSSIRQNTTLVEDNTGARRSRNVQIQNGVDDLSRENTELQQNNELLEQNNSLLQQNTMLLREQSQLLNETLMEEEELKSVEQERLVTEEELVGIEEELISVEEERLSVEEELNSAEQEVLGTEGELINQTNYLAQAMEVASDDTLTLEERLQQLTQIAEEAGVEMENLGNQSEAAMSKGQASMLALGKSVGDLAKGGAIVAGIQAGGNVLSNVIKASTNTHQQNQMSQIESSQKSINAVLAAIKHPVGIAAFSEMIGGGINSFINLVSGAHIKAGDQDWGKMQNQLKAIAKANGLNPNNSSQDQEILNIWSSEYGTNSQTYKNLQAQVDAQNENNLMKKLQKVPNHNVSNSNNLTNPASLGNPDQTLSIPSGKGVNEGAIPSTTSTSKPYTYTPTPPTQFTLDSDAEKELMAVMMPVTEAQNNQQVALDNLRLQGDQTDSYAYMEEQAATNSAISAAAGQQLAVLQKMFPNPNSISNIFIRNDVLQHMAELQQDQLNAQVATLQLWQNQLGTFNLPNGVNPMTYYNYVSQGQSQSQVTASVGGVTIQMNVGTINAHNQNELDEMTQKIGDAIKNSGWFNNAVSFGAGTGLREQVAANPHY